MDHPNQEAITSVQPAPAKMPLFFAVNHSDAYTQTASVAQQILDEIEKHVEGSDRPGQHYALRASLLEAKRWAESAAQTKALDTKLRGARA